MSTELAPIELKENHATNATELTTKTYTYESTNKSGKKVTKKVVRKYTNKKDTSNTLQNKTHKDVVEKNIIDNYDKIMELPERKRIAYIKDNCIPKDVTSSYNTIRSMWTKILNAHK